MFLNPNKFTFNKPKIISNRMAININFIYFYFTNKPQSQNRYEYIL